MTTIAIVCGWHHTHDDGGRWSYVESPCTGNKQTRNVNDDDTHSTRQGCQLIVEPVKWQRGVFVWWWLRVCTCGGSRLNHVYPSFNQHSAHFLSNTTPAGVRHALPPFIVLNDHVLSADPTVMTTIAIVCGWHPYTRVHGGQWPYVDSPCKGRKQTRNMNDNDTQSTWQECQLNVESMTWRRGSLTRWWLRLYVWRFTFDSCISFSHLTPRTLPLKHNARRHPLRSSSVHLIKRSRTACKSDGDDDHWIRLRFAPYTHDHGGQ